MSKKLSYGELDRDGVMWYSTVPIIDLGSCQYDIIAGKYTDIINGKMPDELKKTTESTKIRNELHRSILELSQDYLDHFLNLMITEKYDDLDEDTEIMLNIFDEEDFEIKQEEINQVKTFAILARRQPRSKKAVKQFLIAWFDYWKNSASDLWSVLGMLESQVAMSEYITDCDIDVESSEIYGGMLYLLKVIYNFSDDEIEKMAGDFDT